MRRNFVLLLAAISGVASAQPQSAASMQAQFEAATAKLNANDVVGAIASFEELERSLAANPKVSAASLAVVRVRLGVAYARLGRSDNAREVLGKALANGALDKPAYANDRDDARLTLAGIDELAFNHEAAATLYRRTAAESTDLTTRLTALNGAARSQMFVDNAAALASVDEALRLAASAPGVTKNQLSILYGTRGSVLLNGGQASAARADLVKAVDLRGGLGLKVDQGDIDLRATAALAMLVGGQTEDARKYLAYTGAGRGDAALPFPAEAILPDCGTLDHVSPTDSVVVRFDVLPSGRAANVMPIYASKQGDMAYEFAEMVSGWSWSPEALKDVKPFFLHGARLQLRCSTTNTRGGDSRLNDALRAWLTASGVEPIDDEASSAAQALALKQRLDIAKSAPERIYLLWKFAVNPVFDAKQRSDYAAEAVALARSTDVPPAPRLAIELLALAKPTSGRYDYPKSDAYLNAVKALAAERWVARDPLLRNSVRLQILRSYMERRDDFYAKTTVNQIVADEALPEKDPIKIAALVQLANIEAANKQPAAAAAAYELTGLSAQQCALIDDGPLMRRTVASTSDYPKEASAWGFEGWSQVEYDIGADGKPRGARTVLAYPPEVFSKSSEGVVMRSRYTVSYRPAGDLACTGSTRRVRYQMPT